MIKMFPYRSFKMSLMTIVICLFLTSPVFASLTINLIAVNASEDEVKEIEVKYYLPKELEPEDILDPGTLRIDYDVQKGSYYAYGKFPFQPKQTKNFRIKVNDVWVITEEQIDVLKQQLNGSLDLLEGDENYYVASRARNENIERLDFILSQQKNYSDNITRRIEQYRAYYDELLQIKENAYSLDYLKHDSKAIEEIDKSKTVKFVVEVKNPLEDKGKTIVHKHYLPVEVRDEHVVEKQGFKVRYDEGKERAYLTKEESFKAGEVKKYEFVIQDIWRFPVTKLETIVTRSEIAMEEIVGSVFEESGQYLLDGIMEKISQIRESQAKTLAIKEHIGRFRVNGKRYDEAMSDLEKLEKMMAIILAKKLEEMEGKSVKNVLSKLKALRGLAKLSEALFKSGISVTVTWRIIFGTILFVAFFTTLHFFIWSRRSKTMGEEQGLPGGEEIQEVPKPGSEQASSKDDE